MTTMRHKLFSGSTETLADQRSVRVICSSAQVDRMGDVIVQEGISLDAYRSNPQVLWAHDPKMPIARASNISLVNGQIHATAQFPPEGEDRESDKVYKKIKLGLVNAVSVGFIPIDAEPLDPKAPWGGYKFLKSELLEFSFVSIPANKDCLVIGRSIYAENGELVSQSLENEPDEDMINVPRAKYEQIIAIPSEFRSIAKKIPDAAKGARGQLLRCANLAEKIIGAPVAEPAEQPNTETPPVEEVKTTPRLDMARRRLSLIGA